MQYGNLKQLEFVSNRIESTHQSTSFTGDNISDNLRCRIGILRHVDEAFNQGLLHRLKDLSGGRSKTHFNVWIEDEMIPRILIENNVLKRFHHK